MKNHQRKQKEQGQIIILLAVSIVVVIMVAALAVDGGMIYTERRFAQNAADSAAFAGGGAIYNSGKLDEVLVCPASSSDSLITTIVSQAKARAFANNVSELELEGYEINNDDFVPDKNQGIWVVCNDEADPKTIDVIVRVTSQVSTAFAHLIYPGPLQTTNEAKVRVSQEGVFLTGDAIISLSKVCNSNSNQNKNNGGIIFNNSNLVLNIDGGGVYSSSCINLTNLSNPELIDVEGGFKYTNNIINEDKWSQSLLNQFTKVNNPWNDSHLKKKSPKEECEQLKAANASEHKDDSSDTLVGGYYPDGIKVNGGKNLNLTEGLYCVDKEFDVQNGSVKGANVTIYLFESTTVNINGGTIQLVATTDKSKLYYGILFYMDGAVNTDWNGSNSSHISGVVYAPKRNIVYSGNSDNTLGTCPAITGLNCSTIEFPTQIIGNQIVFKGNSTVNVNNSGKSFSTLQNNLFLKD